MSSRTVPLNTASWTLITDADNFWAQNDGEAAFVTWSASLPVTLAAETPKHRIGAYENVTRNGLSDNLYGIGNGQFTVSE